MEHRTPRAFALLALVGALSAPSCSKHGASPTPAPSFQSETTSVALGPKGGAVDLTGSDGTTYSLAVPTGALAVPTQLSLTTVAPIDDERFHVVVGPPGLLLEPGTAATLTIHTPAGHDLPDSGGLAVDGALVPFSRNADRSLALEIRHTLDLSTTHAHPAPLLVTVASCGTPTASRQGVTAADTVDLAIYAQCMTAAIDTLQTTGQFEDAVRASLAVAALLQRVGGSGAGDAQMYLDTAKTAACTARGAAFDLAAGTSVMSLGDYHAFFRPMAYWEAIVQRLGVTCQGQALFADAASALTDKALALYAADRPMIQDPAGALYHSTLTEATDARKVRREVSALAAPAPVATTVDAQIKDRAEKTLVDELLDGPWTSCRNGGDYAPLMAVMDALTAPDQAKTVAQYCATAIQVEGFSAANPTATSLGTAGPLGDGSRTMRVTTATVPAATDGTVKLTGLARALPCPAGSESPEALVFTLNGMEVQRLNGTSYLTSPVSLDVTQILTTAGITPAMAGSSRTLTITRDGTACNGYWGTNPAPLATLTLSFKRSRVAWLDLTSTATELSFVNADGSGPTQHTTLPSGSSWISLSSDGTRVAFCGATGAGLAVMNVDGSGMTSLPGTANAQIPTWSPDGKRIAFGSPPTISVIDAAGTGLTVVASGSVFAPSWSPDGSLIAMFQASGTPAVCSLMVMNPDGTGLHAVPGAPPCNGAGHPTWSPDGKRLVFYDHAVSGTDEVFTIVNLDGSGSTSIHLPNSYWYDTAWSPAGDKLAYNARQGTGWAISTVNIDGSGAANLFPCAGVCYNPIWL